MGKRKKEFISKLFLKLVEFFIKYRLIFNENVGGSLRPEGGEGILNFGGLSPKNIAQCKYRTYLFRLQNGHITIYVNQAFKKGK